MNQTTPQPTTNTDLQHWTLDKRIPLALLVTLGVQTVAVVAWASTLTADVARAKEDDIKTTLRVEKLEGTSSSLNLLQYRLDQVDQRTARIEAKLDAAREN